MKKNKLIYWRDIPLDVDLNLFSEIAKQYDVITICDADYNNDRKRIGCNEGSDNIKKIIIDNNEDNLIEEYKNDIVLFHGITGRNFFRIFKLFRINREAKVFIIAERPNFYGNFFWLCWRYLTRFIFYTITARYYNQKISGFFAMGDLGVNTYLNYGWSKNKLYPFMYTYKTTEINDTHKVNDKIRFMYIGRFYDETKGILLLIEAFKKLKEYEELIELDLVGGYGPDSEKVFNEIKNIKNISYIGKWNYEDVSIKMNKYDCVIVPSRYDGWNVVPNQAIDAEVGLLVSDGCVSDELIKKAQNGTVFKKNSVSEIVDSIIYVIKNRDKLEEWRNNSKKYKLNISNENISSYFIDVINYCLNGVGDKPEKPW